MSAFKKVNNQFLPLERKTIELQVALEKSLQIINENLGPIKTNN